MIKIIYKLTMLSCVLIMGIMALGDLGLIKYTHLANKLKTIALKAALTITCTLS